MKFLIIDTSGRESFVAIHLSQEELRCEILPPHTQSQTLFPAIKKLPLHSIDFIAVGVGPGLFTGTRVGVMAAKSLGFARSIPLVPFCSLKCYLPKENGHFIITTDAKSHGFYTLEGRKNDGIFSFIAPRLESHNLSLNKPKLNIPCLGAYLLKVFQKNGGILNNEFSVNYLHKP